jgi:hypothetical protein
MLAKQTTRQKPISFACGQKKTRQQIQSNFNNNAREIMNTDYGIKKCVSCNLTVQFGLSGVMIMNTALAGRVTSAQTTFYVYADNFDDAYAKADAMGWLE